MSTFITSRLSLRHALLLDASASGAMGVAVAGAAHVLSPLFGLPVVLLRGAGLSLVPFAVLLVWLAGRAEHAVVGPTRLMVWGVVVGNVLWVLDSVLLALGTWGAPTLLGAAFVLAQGGAVAVFAWLEAVTLRAVAARRANVV